MADEKKDGTGKYQLGDGTVIEKDGSEHFNPFDAVGKWFSGTGHLIATGWCNITGNSEGAAKEWAETCSEYQKGTEEWDLVGEFAGNNGTIYEDSRFVTQEQTGKFTEQGNAKWGENGLVSIGSALAGGTGAYFLGTHLSGGNKLIGAFSAVAGGVIMSKAGPAIANGIQGLVENKSADKSSRFENTGASADTASKSDNQIEAGV